MSFSASISAVPADKFAESVDAVTISNEDAESQALFATAKDAVKALAEKLPNFGSGDVFIQGSLNGHAAAPADGDSWPYNSIGLSVSETAVPAAAVAEAASEDATAADAGAETTDAPTAADETTTEGEDEAATTTDDEEPSASTPAVADETEPEPVEAESEDAAEPLTGQAKRDADAAAAALADAGVATGDSEGDAQPEVSGE